jgi:hypothetical protein
VDTRPTQCLVPQHKVAKILRISCFLAALICEPWEEGAGTSVLSEFLGILFPSGHVFLCSWPQQLLTLRFRLRYFPFIVALQVLRGHTRDLIQGLVLKREALNFLILLVFLVGRRFMNTVLLAALLLSLSFFLGVGVRGACWIRGLRPWWRVG